MYEVTEWSIVFVVANLQQSQFWMPRDVWLLILSAGAEIGLFNDYFKFNLHRSAALLHSRLA